MNSSQSDFIILSSHTENFIFTHKVFGTSDKRYCGTPVAIKQAIVSSNHNNTTTFMRNNSTDTIGSQNISPL